MSSGVTAMEHVLVLADDIDQAREFYCDVVGLELGERPALEFPGYWLYAGATPCLHLAAREPYLEHARKLGLPVAGGAGPGPVDHIAFRGTDYEQTRALLDRKGVPAVLNTVPGGGPDRCSSRIRAACGSRSTSCKTPPGGSRWPSSRQKPRSPAAGGLAAVSGRPRRQPAEAAGAAQGARRIQGRQDRRTQASGSRGRRDPRRRQAAARCGASVRHRRRVSPRLVAHGLHLPDRRDLDGSR